MDNFYIVKTHPNLIAYVDKLQHKNAESLSFYPKQVFERESVLGRIFLGLLNNEPCGYIYVGAGSNGDVKCHQVCIQYDVRRRLYGAELVVALEDYAHTKGASSITLRCGFDLDANEFWKTLGYSCISVIDGGIRRQRKINIWRKFIQPDMFETLTVEPAVGKTSATFWREHKQTGLINGFHRGQSLRDYRTILEGKKRST